MWRQSAYTHASEWTGGASGIRLIAVAVIVVGLRPRPGAAQTCVGDCKGEGTVDITDLIIGVNIALCTADVSTCKAFANSQGKVDVAQLIKGVNTDVRARPSR